MESYKIENISFTYPNAKVTALSNINIAVKNGEFITVCGKSGCGKTTLLRLLKPALSPHGELSGSIFLGGKALSEYDKRSQASKIGFVMQNPDNQIVTDKVWHELAFGLESLGCPTPEIRTRVSEMASYFGIHSWFHKPVDELSGGQKQLLNLAAIMVMQPSALILDEPTGQLDPIAAQEFLKTLDKINRELGTTIILSEHRLEDAFSVSDRIIVMDNGKIIADSKPAELAELLRGNDMYDALPSPMRIWGAVGTGNPPVSVREGREWLSNYASENSLHPELIPDIYNRKLTADTAIELKNIWFRYEKNSSDIIKGLSLKITKGEIYAIVGGNGTGKSTALSIICGINKPYRGDVYISGEKNNFCCGQGLSMLPQNPQSLFVKNSVKLNLAEILANKRLSNDESEAYINSVAELCEISNLLSRHPYDLSGGEQQRAALAMVLLQNPEILLLDEPTKGMDAHFKKYFADIILKLKAKGVTIIMVSHDIEFCAAYADRCAMFFDGQITGEGNPREFFSNKCFYTTSANRMARTHLPCAVLTEDVIAACGKSVEQKNTNHERTEIKLPERKNTQHEKEDNTKITPAKIIMGIIFAVLFAATSVWGYNRYTDWRNLAYLFVTIIEAGIAVLCFIPKKQHNIDVRTERNMRKWNKHTTIAALCILLAVPATIYFGATYLGADKYYLISLLIIPETFIPFLISFESRKPNSRELVIISVICAIAVAGRVAFSVLPQFKPVLAIVIISGICFGGETGFLVGAVTGFVSNFIFGQGPWTPWQMFSFGMVGFISGILFQNGLLCKKKLSLAIYGFLATIFIFGIIANCTNVLVYPEMFPELNFNALVASCLMGLPYDLIHAVSTAFFLWFISEPMCEKIERVKQKYGIK